MKPMKYSGYYLVATGVIHSLIGLALGWNTLIEMHQDHWFSSTVLNGQMLFDREAIEFGFYYQAFSGFYLVLCAKRH